MNKNEKFNSFGGKTTMCPICGTLHAMEETEGEITSWLCVECGFTTNTNMKKNCKELLSSPKAIQELKVWDKEQELYWIPTVINMASRGIIFPESHGSQIIWIYVPIVDISDEEQKNYPIADQPGKYHTRRLDTEQSKKFTRFYDALKCLGAIIDEPK